MLSMFDSGEEFPPLPPLRDCSCFVRVHLDLPTSSCTVCVEGVIVLVLDYLPFAKSEVTREEFPPIIVSPRTYFRKTYLDCSLFVTLISHGFIEDTLFASSHLSCGNRGVARVKDSDRASLDPTTAS